MNRGRTPRLHLPTPWEDTEIGPARPSLHLCSLLAGQRPGPTFALKPWHTIPPIHQKRLDMEAMTRPQERGGTLLGPGRALKTGGSREPPWRYCGTPLPAPSWVRPSPASSAAARAPGPGPHPGAPEQAAGARGGARPAARPRLQRALPATLRRGEGPDTAALGPREGRPAAAPAPAGPQSAAISANQARGPRGRRGDRLPRRRRGREDAGAGAPLADPPLPRAEADRARTSRAPHRRPPRPTQGAPREPPGGCALPRP